MNIVQDTIQIQADDSDSDTYYLSISNKCKRKSARQQEVENSLFDINTISTRIAYDAINQHCRKKLSIVFCPPIRVIGIPTNIA